MVHRLNTRAQNTPEIHSWGSEGQQTHQRYTRQQPPAPGTCSCSFSRTIPRTVPESHPAPIRETLDRARCLIRSPSTGVYAQSYPSFPFVPVLSRWLNATRHMRPGPACHSPGSAILGDAGNVPWEPVTPYAIFAALFEGNRRAFVSAESFVGFRALTATKKCCCWQPSTSAVKIHPIV